MKCGLRNGKLKAGPKAYRAEPLRKATFLSWAKSQRKQRAKPKPGRNNLNHATSLSIKNYRSGTLTSEPK